ncbi:nitrate ABC transporter permease [Cupriavidus basilensis]|uniref:Nitrate ABC transporter permease n=1 Tax=Cupriavidus basilensis TaxID=68895 RepID=A0A643FNU6_9BURK|nr:nitrate ABC transporter permease [Cupriavidus basilensis]
MNALARPAPHAANQAAPADAGTNAEVAVVGDQQAHERAERRALAAQAEARRAARRDAIAAVVLKVMPPVAGFALFLLMWHGIATMIPAIPTPAATWHAAVPLFADPFYRNGPNDQGIGWNVLASLARVAAGFGLAALIGIPAGFALGRFAFLNAMMAPIISLLRPVSPLAWLPIGLLLFKSANPAAIWAIFICSIWPMVINTAVGVTRVPQDYLNVARVLDLSEWKVFTRVLLPAVLPYMLTGVRLSIGTAWLVIVAAEMLTGGTGIGFWLWDEWNNLKVEHIVIAIFIIGMVGLLLEYALLSLAKRFSYGN